MTAHPSLWDAPPEAPACRLAPSQRPDLPSIGETAQTFDGATYNKPQDGQRLGAQLRAVKHVMRDGAWHTLEDLSLYVGAPQSSISARLRDLRKPRFGAWTVQRRRVQEGGGTYEYRMVSP